MNKVTRDILRNLGKDDQPKIRRKTVKGRTYTYETYPTSEVVVHSLEGMYEHWGDALDRINPLPIDPRTKIVF